VRAFCGAGIRARDIRWSRHKAVTPAGERPHSCERTASGILPGIGGKPLLRLLLASTGAGLMVFTTGGVVCESFASMAAEPSEHARRRSSIHRPFVCGTDVPANFSPRYHFDINDDLNDLGLIVEDASTRRCVAVARERLAAKIRSAFEPAGSAAEMRTPFGSWLSGGNVALIFAAASSVHGHGQMTAELDRELMNVRDAYLFEIDRNCGFGQGRWVGLNTCMDDYAVAASAYAWIAAFESSRGRESEPWGLAAIEALRAALGSESICIHRPDLDASNPCNASVGEVLEGRAEVMSFNHGQQSVHYGFGLMTSVAAAVLALSRAGIEFEFDADEKARAIGLIAEAQSKCDPDGRSFKLNCARNLRHDGRRWQADHEADCGESLLFGYRPGMYPLSHFYTRYVGPPPATSFDFGAEQPAYPFDSFDATLFGSSRAVFQNAGRRVTYGLLAYRWWVDPPPLAHSGLPLNDYAPIGRLENIDEEGVARGWACDPDDPRRAVEVRIRFVDGEWTEIVADTSAGEWRDSSSDSCDARDSSFTVQLPPRSAGRRLAAFAVDLSSGEAFPLPDDCDVAGGCRWGVRLPAAARDAQLNRPRAR
jgi:hypothetical protein